MSHHFLFIGIKVQTNREILFGELGGDYGVNIADGHDGTFTASPEDFACLSSLISKMCDWFYIRNDFFECEKDTNKILNYYGEKDFVKILNLKQSDIVKVTVYSTMVYWDEPFGSSLLIYDVPSSILKIKNINCFLEPSSCDEDSDYYLIDEYRRIN